MKDYINPPVPQIVILCALLTAKNDSQRVSKIRSLVGCWNDLNQSIEMLNDTQLELLKKEQTGCLEEAQKETLVKVSIELRKEVARLHAFLRGCRVTAQKNWKGKLEA